MKRKLTEATIKSLNPLDKRKIYPADYPGLELWINPGGGRTWYFQYRVKGKKHTERFRVGNYPKITIREAELRAKKIDNDLFLGKVVSCSLSLILDATNLGVSKCFTLLSVIGS